MATKTSSKTATRKPAARKTAPAPKPASPKAKGSKKKLEADTESAHTHAAASVQARAQQPASAKPVPQTLRHEVERVSLIDKEKAGKKAEGEVKPKRQVLPPISRIRASLETTVAAPKVSPSAPPAESHPHQTSNHCQRIGNRTWIKTASTHRGADDIQHFREYQPNDRAGHRVEDRRKPWVRSGERAP